MQAQCSQLVTLGLVATSLGAAKADGAFLSVKDGRFVDPAGRHVILHGVNIGAKHKKTEYVSWHQPSDFARMETWGFNCVRLLIIWAAIEPECGKYDDAFLERIDQRIAWAKKHGLYVLLDMHQDLWGEKPGGDGAPEWATLDKGRPHRKLGHLWSDAYLVSPMIQTAFDSFWANRPGPDGVGIQDRFALAWQHVAKRYADEPAVVGYDLLNEPFPGSDILLMQAKMIPQLVEILAPGAGVCGLLEVARQLKDPVERHKVFERFNDMDAYRKYVEVPAPVCQRFERTKLTPMYQRVARAIREVDRRHILFIEPSITCNQGIASALQPVVGADGRPDPLVALAPHAYDLVTDVRGAGAVSEPRTAFIYRRHHDTVQRLNVPSLVGEWGALGVQPAHFEAAAINVRQLEATLASDTYWYFGKGMAKGKFFKMLQRPYPTAVAGVIVRYRLDTETGVFECVWREDPAIKAPSRFYVPSIWYPDGHHVTVDPPGPGRRFKRVGPGNDGHWSVKPLGRAAERTLVIRPKR